MTNASRRIENDMKYQMYVALTALLLIVGSVAVALRTANIDWLAESQTVDFAGASPPLAEVDEDGLTGAYSGIVALDFTAGGVFSGTLDTPTETDDLPDLGRIDLSLQLVQSSGAVSGYVTLDETLVFDTQHTVNDGTALIEVGPYVSGGMSGSDFSLHSEKVSVVLGGQTVERQFQLTGTTTAADGSEISGEYRETVWGYANEPVTVVGRFILQRPVFETVLPEGGGVLVAMADQVTTPKDTPVTIDVLANDTATVGSTLVITSVSNPQFGTVVTNGQTVTYIPNTNFVGQDNFSYVVSASNGNTATGSVMVTVGGGAGEIYLPLIMR